MNSIIRLLRGDWQLLAFGFVMTFASAFGQTYFIALFGGEIRADLDLGHGDFGSIYSGATLVSALLLLKTGGLIDRMDLRHLAVCVALGLATGGVLLASAYSVALLFLAILLLRQSGQGLMGMAGATAMVRYLPEHRGKANAISSMGYSVSEALLPSAVIALLAVLSWRQSWLVWSTGLALLLPLAVLALLRGHGERHRRYLDQLQRVASTDDSNTTAAQRQWTRDEVIRDPLFYLFLPAVLATPMLFTGFMFHQVHLVESKGWSLAAWGGLYTLYAVVSTLMKLVTGFLVDHFGAIRLVPLMVLPMGLGLLVLATGDSIAVAATFMTLLGITVGGYATLSSPFFAEKYGTLHMGSIKSVTSAAMVFASAISPVLMGWLIDAGVSMETQALGSVGYVVLAATLAWIACSRSLAASVHHS